MDLTVWLAFVAASTVLLLIPGPTVLLVLSYAMSRGRATALASAAGVAVGDFIAMTASLLGLGALVMASATAFLVLKWLGAAYLVYLGISLLRSAPTVEPGPRATETQTQGVFYHAAIVTALNPKSIAFFIAFVPQFVMQDAALVPQFAILIVTFVLLAALNALAYALLADRMRSMIARPSVAQWTARAGGMALIGMGIMTAAMKRTN